MREVKPCANREVLLRLVHQSPGLTFRGLGKASGIPAATVRHHVTVLMRLDAVWECRVGVRLLHFPGHKPVALWDQLEALRDVLDLVDRTFLDLADHGQLSQAPFFDAAPHLPRSTVQNRLKRLVRYGLMTEGWQGRLHVYRSTVGLKPSQLYLDEAGVLA